MTCSRLVESRPIRLGVAGTSMRIPSLIYFGDVRRLVGFRALLAAFLLLG